MLKRGFSFAPGYRLEQFLGRGQFGQVWRASAPGGTAAAIKFIDLSGSEGEKEHAGIKRVKQIRHANLMPITAIWLLDVHGKPIEEVEEVDQETLGQIPINPAETAGDLSSAMEATAASIVTPPKDAETEPAWLVVGMLLGGKSLQQRLRECVKNGLPGIPPKELLAYMDESAKGLDFLNIAQHDLGDGMVAIQHCDVKPANIVLIGSSAVVCDFGLARILTRNQVTATSASGTPAYMAPEAIAGKPSRTSDQYSLAVTYYHLRTGTLPISDGTLWEVLDAHRTGKLDLSRVPEHEQAVLRRATALDWDKRFESNLDFVESLREALRAEGHTRPVMMPAVSNVNSPPTMPTNVLDPSLTLVPGQDVTTPMTAVVEKTPAGEQKAAASSVAGASDTRRNVADQTAIEAAPLSIDAEIPAQQTTGSAALPRQEWWLQPQWLAIAAIAIVAPMLLIVLFSGGSEEPSGGNGANGNGAVIDEPMVKTLDQWLEESASLLGKDDEAARKAFDEAAKQDPSVLQLSKPRLLVGHSGQVRGIEFSANGDSMISIADQKMPFQWSLASLNHNKIGQSSPTTADPKHVPVVGSDQMIEALAANLSNDTIAAADLSGQLTLTAFADAAKPLKSLALGDETPESVIWHPVTDDVVVASTGDLSTIIWIPKEAMQAPQTYRFEIPQMLQSATIDPLGKYLLIHDFEGVVSQIAWADVEAIRQTQGAPAATPVTSTGTRVAVMTTCFGHSNQDAVLVTGGEDGEVTIWSLGSAAKAIHRQLIHGSQVTAIAVSAKGLQGPIVSGDDAGMIGVWRDTSAQSLVKLPVHRAAISSLDISSDGNWVAAGSHDGDVSLWNLAKAQLPMLKLSSQAGPVTFVRMDLTGRWLAAGHEEGAIELWDLRHAKMLVSESSLQDAVPEKPAKPPNDSSSI